MTLLYVGRIDTIDTYGALCVQNNPQTILDIKAGDDFFDSRWNTAKQ